MTNEKIDGISERATQILSKPYTRRLEPDELGGYVASIQEFPGCIAEGDTPGDAISNLDNSALSWIEAALATGYGIRDPISFDGCSGKIALRLPRGLHKQVSELAELEETSINQLLVTAIANYVGEKHAQTKMSEVMLFEIRKVMSDGLVTFYRNNPWTLLITSKLGQRIPYKAATTFEGQVVTAKTYQLGAIQ